ncbi:G-protein coupled receptors family 1 profile domain-containing protein [Caenorhabditis elegans]|uniref:G-protein coupled receptors family 1 profile domain-containing protein n=1 Tax=Caenorhabditis elegans TaxID=6239 RepID=O44673_CAEEL|nr:G-protein coupled receptors family 1 profile domain-containing protein [Caenorhabditis elegans]CCD64465.1 G-protein coupled receptors family 1 profile domain-containing protein [Caenorhabditis elegans]|eukprot:NP_503244.2 Serpentine Receptor, class X [Caenorhabditis elegans]
MSVKWFIGMSSFTLTSTAIFTNFLILPPILILGFSNKKNATYVIAFFNIISDLLMLSVNFHFSASLIADRYILSEERTSNLSVFFGWVFLVGWFMESLIQPVMAVNRFTVITLNRQDVFTFYRTIFIFILIIAVASAAATFSQYIFPCCIFVGDISIMSYMAVTIPNVYSYSKLIILSFDLFCTGISTVCYASVFITIRNASKGIEDAANSKKRKQDTRYLLQFVFISGFYIAAWSLFYVLPYIVPADKPIFYTVVPFFITLNGSSNSIIFLTYNTEIRKFLKFSSLRNKVASTTQIASVTAPA